MKFLKIKNNFQALLVLSFMDLKLRYQSTSLGFFWSFLKPLLQFVVYYTIFGKLLHVDGGSQYPLRLFFGILIWAWFAESTSLGLNAFIGKRSLITKIRTNRLFPPVAAFLTPTINYFLNFLIFIVIFLILTPWGSLHFSIFAPLIFIYSLICLSILMISLNLLLANINVFFRDTQPIWELVLTYGVFLTPVIYAIPIPGRYQLLYCSINLLAFPLQNMKMVFFTGQPNLLNNSAIVIVYNVILVGTFFIALLIHKKLSKHIADYI